VNTNTIDTQPQKESTFQRAREFSFELVKVVLISLAIIIPIRHFLIQPFYVKGASMEPNFYDHEYLIVDELSYRLRAPARGEVIVFRAPGAIKQYFIKRIIGLPGETIEVNSGRILLNSKELQETYLPSYIKTNGEVKRTLLKDEYFVMGDNRGSSFDSRSFGPINQSAIVGRALIRGWPLNRATVFEAPMY
jgi:signal peptidase I